MVIRIVVILCIALLLTLSMSLKASAANLCMPDMSGNTGSAVEIPINVDDTIGITGFQFCVTYDCSVIDCTGITEGDLTSGWSITSGPGNSGSCQLCVAVYNPVLTPLLSGDGSLVNLQCNVIGNSGMQTDTCLNTIVLSDELGNKISTVDCGCSVFTAIKVHDIDGDNDVDIVDVMMVASRWNTSSGDQNYDAKYDLDNDDDIDIVDIMLVAAQWPWP
jgi:hypothetical protein